MFAKARPDGQYILLSKNGQRGALSVKTVDSIARMVAIDDSNVLTKGLNFSPLLDILSPFSLKAKQSWFWIRILRVAGEVEQPKRGGESTMFFIFRILNQLFCYLFFFLILDMEKLY